MTGPFVSWKTATGKLVRNLVGHTGSLGVAFSQDGKLIASAGFDKTVRAPDAATGREKITLRGHTDTVWSVAFSPDPESTRLVSASTRRRESGTPLRSPNMWVQDSSHSPDTATESTAGKLAANCTSFDFPILAVTYSLAGRRVASGGSDRAVKVWDARMGTSLQTLSGHEGAVHGVAFSPDGKSPCLGELGPHAERLGLGLGPGEAVRRPRARSC